MLFIEQSLETLHSKFNNKKGVQVLSEQGNTETVSCSFNSPIPDEKLTLFQKEIGIELPKDYITFLKHHNGAKIFELLLGDTNIGGGLQLYSLVEIQSQLQDAYLDKKFVPIGYVSESHLTINIEEIKKGNPNYLFLGNPAFEFRPLNLNFELFFDRFIISQGSNFWDWPIYTAQNYYELNRGIE